MSDDAGMPGVAPAFAGLEAKFKYFVERLNAADDAISGLEAVPDSKPLEDVTSKLYQVVTPMDDMHRELAQLIDTLKPYVQLAEALDQSKIALVAAEAALEERDHALTAAQEQLATDQTAVRRAKEDVDQDALTVLLASNDDSDASLRELTTQLAEMRAQLRAAEDSVASKAKVAAKRNSESSSLRAQLAKAEEANAELQDDLNRTTKAFEKRIARADTKIEDAAMQLEQSQMNHRRAQELLAAESRKQRVLQYALQKELSSKGPHRSVDEAWGSRRVGSAPPHATRLSPDRYSADVAETMQRNQNLLNDVRTRKVENFRLRQDNATLLLHAKDANKGQYLLRAQVSTSVQDRSELMRRLQESQEQVEFLKEQLQKTAETVIRRHQLERAKEDQRRWARIEGLGTNDLAHKRLGKDRGPARTRNVPVGSWGSYSNGRPNKGGRMG